MSGLFERAVEDGSVAPTRSFADRTPTPSCRSRREKGEPRPSASDKTRSTMLPLESGRCGKAFSSLASPALTTLQSERSGLFERAVENGSVAPTRSFADRTPTQSCRSRREKRRASTVCCLLVQRREGFVSFSWFLHTGFQSSAGTWFTAYCFSMFITARQTSPGSGSPGCSASF